MQDTITIQAMYTYDKRAAQAALQGFFNRVKVRGRLAPRIVCNDGWSVSAQVGAGLYCSPRSDIGPWQEVELGYPECGGEVAHPDPDGEKELTISEMKLLDLREDSYSDVYPYVPIELLVELLIEHGGIDWEATKETI